MAKSKAKAYSDVQWVNLDLQVKQAEHMKQVYADVEKILFDWERLLQDKYKVTVQADTYNECFSAYIIPMGEDHPNKGHILSARGSDFLKAVRGALYRHYVLFDGVWTDHQREVVDSD